MSLGCVTDVIDGDEADVYVRSPRTAAEESASLFPGSRFLNTNEFKRIYLAGSGSTISAAARRCFSASTDAEFSSQKRSTSSSPWRRHVTLGGVGPSHSISVPHRPPTSSTASHRRRVDRREAARRLRSIYGSGGNGAAVMSLSEALTGPSPPPRETKSATIVHQVGDLEWWESQTVAAAESHEPHPSLPSQIRARVDAARRKPSASKVKKPTHLPLSHAPFRTEEAWLALQRETSDAKAEIRSLQRQLQRAHVLLRSLHGLEAADTDEESENDADETPFRGGQPASTTDALSSGKSPTRDGANGGKASAVARTPKKPGAGAVADGAIPSELPRSRHYWQRRTYFLEMQNETLRAEVERLNRDARGSKLRVTLKELELVRAELKRQRRQRSSSEGVSKGPSAAGDNGTPTHPTDEASKPSKRMGVRESAPAAGSPSVPLKDGEEVRPTTIAFPVDEVILREKDETILSLRERLRLLSQQYQKGEAQLQTTTRQLEDVTHRYNSTRKEWTALLPLPQELARAEQQLSVAQARLVASNREVHAFHQVFDTMEPPATLRAIVEERDHLVELLRQRQLSEAALREEFKILQERTVTAAEKKYRNQYVEACAMSRDRGAHQQSEIKRLQTRILALERAAEVQKEAFETELAELTELAQERDETLTERLLESIRQPEIDAGDDALYSTAPLTEPPPPGTPRSGGTPPLTAASSPSRYESFSQTSLPSQVQPGRDDHRSAVKMAAAEPPSSRPQNANVPSTSSSSVTAVSQTAGESPLSSMSSSLESSITAAEDSSLRSRSSEGSMKTGSYSVENPPQLTTSGNDRKGPKDAVLSAVHAPAKPDGSTKPPADGSAHSVNEDAVRAGTVSTDSNGSLSSSATVEKDNGPDSVPSSAPLTPLSASDPNDGKGKRSGATPADAKAVNHPQHTIHLPAPPIAVAPPVSILINRAATEGPTFSRSLRAVVRSPQASPNQTESPTDPSHTQNAPLSATDKTSGSSNSDSSSSSNRNSTDAGESPFPPMQPKDINIAEGRTDARDALEGSDSVESSTSRAADAEVNKFNNSAIYSGAAVAVENIAKSMLPLLPDDSVPPTGSLPLHSERRDEEAVVPLQVALRKSPSPPSTVPPLGAGIFPTSLTHTSAANSPPTVGKRSPFIPSPPALTPPVSSDLYPSRQSSFFQSGLAGDEEMGSSGSGRGGAFSLTPGADYTSGDLAHQYSGNTSFDFVGALAERHRFEETQNSAVPTLQMSSVSGLGGADGAGVRADKLESKTGNLRASDEPEVNAAPNASPSPPSPAAIPLEKSVMPVTPGHSTLGELTAAAPVASVATAVPELPSRGEGEAQSPGHGDADESSSNIPSERFSTQTLERKNSGVASGAAELTDDVVQHPSSDLQDPSPERKDTSYPDIKGGAPSIIIPSSSRTSSPDVCSITKAVQPGDCTDSSPTMLSDEARKPEERGEADEASLQTPQTSTAAEPAAPSLSVEPIRNVVADKETAEMTAAIRTAASPTSIARPPPPVTHSVPLPLPPTVSVPLRPASSIPLPPPAVVPLPPSAQ